MPLPTTAVAATRLSVIVITRNEAHQLARCLGSVSFADEIVVVDWNSSDGTPALARQCGARVIETSDWPGFGRQKQRALDAATGEWVLALDADEWLDAELASAIQQVVRGEKPCAAAGFELSRLSAFCGQWMRAGSWYPDFGLRLVRRELASYSLDLVHERLLVQGPVERLPGQLLHNSTPDLDLALNKLNRYTSDQARQQVQGGKRSGLGRALAAGVWAFVRNYLFKRGFLDGRLGLVLALHNAEYTYYRYLKIWLLSRPQAELRDPNARPARP